MDVAALTEEAEDRSGRVRFGPRKGRELRTEVLTLRMTPSARAELRRLAVEGGTTEGDMVRLLIGEALAERARTRRR